jgi:Histone methylation protein DOT1
MGGDASKGAMYGELTKGSMERICIRLNSFYDMDGKTFFDVGSGLNRPATTAASFFPRMKSALGGEYMVQRTSLAAKCLQVMLEDKSSQSKAHAMAPINVVNMNAMDLTDITGLGIDVLFTFNSAFEPALMYKLADIVNTSDIEALIIFSNPKELEDYGFEGLEWKGSLALKMSHSNEGKTANFFLRQKKTTAGVVLVPSHPALMDSASTTRVSLRKRKLVDDSAPALMDSASTKSVSLQKRKLVDDSAPPTLTHEPQVDDEQHDQSGVAPHLGQPESEMLRAMKLCEDAGSRKELIEYLKSTFDNGLKTSEQVRLPDGQVVKKGIREKKIPDYFGF